MQFIVWLFFHSTKSKCSLLDNIDIWYNSYWKTFSLIKNCTCYKDISIFISYRKYRSPKRQLQAVKKRFRAGVPVDRSVPLYGFQYLVFQGIPLPVPRAKCSTRWTASLSASCACKQYSEGRGHIQKRKLNNADE